MVDYIGFVELVNERTAKTKVWNVVSLSGNCSLGKIKWFGRWRQYCFFPEPNTIFNKKCLNDISTMIHREMEARKK